MPRRKYRRPATIQDGGLVLKQSLSFTLTLLIDLVDADLLIPGRDGKVFTGGGETKVGDAILWRHSEGDIF